MKKSLKLLAGATASAITFTSLCASVSAFYIIMSNGNILYIPDAEDTAIYTGTQSAEEKVTLYAADGRSEQFPVSMKEAQLAVGWYEEPMVTLYAADGREQAFPASMKEAQLSVGWYESKYVTLYTEDGRSESFHISVADAQKSVGWFGAPEITLYAPDGRRELFPLSMRSPQLSVGWYEYPVTTVYTTDGRSEVIPEGALAAWLSVGWYEEYTKMYDIYGWPEYIHWTELENAANKGYYSQPQEFEFVDTRDLSEKYARVFPNEGIPFADATEAYACMKSITVPVWVLQNNGTKKASTKKLTVNAALADDVISIFTEIFNDPSQFPMKDVGCYNWRSTAGGNRSHHSYGTCIDINANENYYCYADGTAITGSHWKPGVDPYSIAGNGIVVRTFAKYGFLWGGNAWGREGKKDYMHFTYLGD